MCYVASFKIVKLSNVFHSSTEHRSAEKKKGQGGCWQVGKARKELANVGERTVAANLGVTLGEVRACAEILERELLGNWQS